MSDEVDGAYLVAVAHHPSVFLGLSLLRGYPETVAFVTKVLGDTRGGARHGFSTEVLAALLEIQLAHQHLVKVSDDNADPWGNGRGSFDR